MTGIDLRPAVHQAEMYISGLIYWIVVIWSYIVDNLTDIVLSQNWYYNFFKSMQLTLKFYLKLSLTCVFSLIAVGVERFSCLLHYCRYIHKYMMLCKSVQQIFIH